MKKFCKVAAFALALMVSGGSIFAGTIPKVYLNDNKVFMQQSPFINNGTTYVPLRALEQFGFIVDWNAASEIVTLNDGKNTVIQKVGSSVAKVNGTDIELGSSAIKKNGAVFVPLRFIEKAVGGELKFDSKTNRIDATFEINKRDGYDFDSLGRYIKLWKTPLNDTKNYNNHYPVGITESLYEPKLSYDLGGWVGTPVEGPVANQNQYGVSVDFIRPKNMSKYNRYKDEYLKGYVDVLEKHLDLVLNLDFRTINEQWANDMVSTRYFDPTSPYAERHKKEALDYVKYVKTNKIIVEGDFFVEPTTTHYSTGLTKVRVWVKFKANKDIDIFDEVPHILKGNTWYEGFVDMGLASQLSNNDGTTLIVMDSPLSVSKNLKPIK